MRTPDASSSPVNFLEPGGTSSCLTCADSKGPEPLDTSSSEIRADKGPRMGGFERGCGMRGDFKEASAHPVAGSTPWASSGTRRGSTRG